MNFINSPVSKWWRNKRLQYNKALLFTGLMGFLVQAALPALKNGSFTNLFFEMLISGTCYIVMMIVFNVAFTLGCILDFTINHWNSQLYRERLFLVGYWFSVVILILMIVTFLYLFN
jgi:hypothetical protein